MTEADSYDEADEGEETRVVIQYRRSTKVAGKGSCIRLGVSGVCATASALSGGISMLFSYLILFSIIVFPPSQWQEF